MPNQRQSVHQSPWQAPSTARGTQALPAERRCPNDARAYIRALGQRQVLHRAHNCYRQSGGARACYRQSGGAQTTPERTSEPLASTKYCAGHASATGRAAVPKRRQQSGGAQTTPGRTSEPLARTKYCTRRPSATGRAAVPKRRQSVHQSPWPAPSTAQGTQMLPAERRCPNDARAYIRALGQRQVLRRARKCYRQSGGAQTTPERTSEPLASTKYCTGRASATGRAAAPKRRQGVHLPSTKYCAGPASATGRAAPERTSEPLASTKYCTGHANATGRAAVPKRRQSVHQSPWPAPSTAQGTQVLPAERRQSVHQSPWPAPSTAQGTQVLPAERRCPNDARAYIRALGQHQVLHRARKCYRQSGGAQPTPERTSDLASTKYCTGHASATGRAAVPKRRQSVHQTWQAPSTAQGAQVLPAERRCPNDARAYIRALGQHQVLRRARKRYRQSGGPNDARAYIRALGQHQVLHRARKCYRQSGGAQTTPERTSEPLASTKYCTGHANATGRAAVPNRRQSVHQSPWPAPSTAQGTQVLPAERRCPNDARAYIRLGKHQVLHRARKSYRQSGGAQTTPERTSEPLTSAKYCTGHASATGRAAVPKRRQSVHQSPWQAPSTAQE